MFNNDGLRATESVVKEQLYPRVEYPYLYPEISGRSFSHIVYDEADQFDPNGEMKDFYNKHIAEECIRELEWSQAIRGLKTNSETKFRKYDVKVSEDEPTDEERENILKELNDVLGKPVDMGDLNPIGTVKMKFRDLTPLPMSTKNLFGQDIKEEHIKRDKGSVPTRVQAMS